MNRLPVCTAGAVACWPMVTDTTERGLERLLFTALAGQPCDPPAESAVAEPSAGYGGVASHDIINFPTKRLWHGKSRREDIEAGRLVEGRETYLHRQAAAAQPRGAPGSVSV